MEFQKELCISKEEAEEYHKLLTIEPKSHDECMGEDVTITNTVKFDDGTEMDIKICGVQYRPDFDSNLPWTEAVLFKNGIEIGYTEPSDEYEGKWFIEDHDGNTYTVIVVAS